MNLKRVRSFNEFTLAVTYQYLMDGWNKKIIESHNDLVEWIS